VPSFRHELSTLLASADKPAGSLHACQAPDQVARSCQCLDTQRTTWEALWCGLSHSTCNNFARLFAALVAFRSHHLTVVLPPRGLRVAACGACILRRHGRRQARAPASAWPSRPRSPTVSSSPEALSAACQKRQPLTDSADITHMCPHSCSACGHASGRAPSRLAPCCPAPAPRALEPQPGNAPASRHCRPPAARSGAAARAHGTRSGAGDCPSPSTADFMPVVAALYGSSRASY
jgi:hypothetical protein